MNFVDQFDALHDMASDATGLTDFGTDNYHEPMRRYLSCLDDYDRLSETGIATYTQTVVGLLVGRLMLVQGLKDNPAATQTPIEKPIIIVGMGRTGTTALHRLLSLDPQFQTLPFWLANAPMPRPPRETWASNPAFVTIKNGLAQSQILNDEMRDIHPVHAELADECRWVIDQTFWSSTLALMTDSRAYLEWFHNADSRYAHEYYRQVLQLIANGDSRRWVLKDPGHMFGIQSLLEVFPDACVVQTHREPVESMRSFANLGWEARNPLFTDQTRTEEENGRRILEDGCRGLKNLEQFRRQADNGRFFDLHMLEIKTDPVGSIERVFDHFDIPVTEEAVRSWQQQSSVDPQFGHRKNHSPPEFGLTKEAVDQAVGIYLDRYRKVGSRITTGI